MFIHDGGWWWWWRLIKCSSNFFFFLSLSLPWSLVVIVESWEHDIGASGGRIAFTLSLSLFFGPGSLTKENTHWHTDAPTCHKCLYSVCVACRRFSNMHTAKHSIKICRKNTYCHYCDRDWNPKNNTRAPVATYFKNYKNRLPNVILFLKKPRLFVVFLH